MAPKHSDVFNNYSNTARKVEVNSLQDAGARAASSARRHNGSSTDQCRLLLAPSGISLTGSHGSGKRLRSLCFQDRPPAVRHQSPGTEPRSAYDDLGPRPRFNNQYRQGDNCGATDRGRQPGQGIPRSGRAWALAG